MRLRESQGGGAGKSYRGHQLAEILINPESPYHVSLLWLGNELWVPCRVRVGFENWSATRTRWQGWALRSGLSNQELLAESWGMGLALEDASFLGSDGDPVWS